VPCFRGIRQRLDPDDDTPKACRQSRAPHAFAVMLQGRSRSEQSAKAWHPAGAFHYLKINNPAATAKRYPGEPIRHCRWQRNVRRTKTKGEAFRPLHSSIVFLFFLPAKPDEPKDDDQTQRDAEQPKQNQNHGNTPPSCFTKRYQTDRRKAGLRVR
jgi:hypothetical protein